MAVNPSPIGGFAGQFFDNNGQPLSGGKVYTYAAGTTTPQATYTSALGITPHSNPIVLDSAGRVPGGEIWLTDQLIYKFVFETSTAILIGTYDNITGVNSNFVNYTAQEEVITATAGQTVFNLSTINYTPGTNSLSVYIDGVNQYVNASYLETNSTTVTFTSGLHGGAEVKFTTAVQTTTGAVDAAIVSYDPPFTNSVVTNVEAKLAQSISLKDFGAVGDGATDDTNALINFFAAVIANNGNGFIPAGTYRFTSPIAITNAGEDWVVMGAGSANTVLTYDGSNTATDILTIGNGTDSVARIKLGGFVLRSSKTMTAGIGLHLRKLVRSWLNDLVIDGQDGNGNLWHGIRFNGLDNVYWTRFEARAQKDAVQVNGLVGAQPKADLHISEYKIMSSDVGIRFGGAFGGFYTGPGSVAVCGDSVVIDTTLVAEPNREVFFSDHIALDAPSRCNCVIDQAIAAELRVNFPSGMWIASSGSHGIWVKNAAGAQISVNAYIYNITNADGLRISDATAYVQVDDALFANILGTGYGINATVATGNLKLANPRFVDVTNAYNYAANRAVTDLAFPVAVQGGRALLWDTYAGTLDGAGNATIPHGKGGTYPSLVVGVMVGVKEIGGSWRYVAPTFVDGTNINVAAGAGYAGRPYNVTVIVGDQANAGW